MQTRKDGIRGKIIRSHISKSCGFIQLKTLFLENQNLLGTLLQIRLPARQEPGPLSPVQLFLLATGSLLSSMPTEPGVRSQPKQSAGRDPPMTNYSICSNTGGVFQILLVVIADILRWFFFFPGVFPSCASAPDNQGSFHSPSASKNTLIFFSSLLKYSLGLFNQKEQKRQCAPFMPYILTGKYSATQPKMVWIAG